MPDTLGSLSEAGLISIRTGPFGSALHAHEYIASGVSVIPAEAIVEGKLDAEKLVYISETKAEELERYRVHAGDIVFARRGAQACGKSALVKSELHMAIAGTGIIALRINDTSAIHPKFLSYLVGADDSVQWLKHHAIGATMPNLNSAIILTLPASIPVYQEQKSIANILGTLDDKIELNRQMNATLEAMAQALFKSWFVDFDPVIDNALAAGNPIPEPLQARAEIRKALGDKRKPLPDEIQKQFPSSFVFSEDMDGWVPEGWKISDIGSIAEVIDCLHSKKPEKVEDDTGKVLLQLNNIRDDGLLDLSDKYFISIADYEKWISRIEVEEGDCVITNVGRVGAVSIVPSGVKAAMGRNMTAVRLKNKDLKAFLITLLTSEFMKMEIARRTDVGTILNALNVKSIPILRFIDAGDLLLIFEQQVRELLSKREEMLRQSSVLGEIRDTLLPKLLSGQLRIPEAEAIAEQVAAG